ncbi:MAG: permease [candidate division NC10 bacterium]|nr:permease [candidate division NC10 bacterium]
MRKRRGGLNMIIPTVVMAILAILLLLIGSSRGGGEHWAGLKWAVQLLIQILPLLVFAFIVAGMIQVLVPQELLSRWIGEKSGTRGIWIGTVAGGFSPGGPYVSLPIVAALLHSGASVGTLVAFLTGWSLWAVARIPMEVGILGWRFTLIRLGSTFFFPPIAGWIAQLLFSGFKATP